MNFISATLGGSLESTLSAQNDQVKFTAPWLNGPPTSGTFVKKLIQLVSVASVNANRYCFVPLLPGMIGSWISAVCW